MKYEVKKNIKMCKCKKCNYPILTDIYYLNKKSYCLRCVEDIIYENFFYNNVINCIDYLEQKYSNHSFENYSMYQLNRIISAEKMEDLILWLKAENIFE